MVTDRITEALGAKEDVRPGHLEETVLMRPSQANDSE